jgi:hypothetical protein
MALSHVCWGTVTACAVSMHYPHMSLTYRRREALSHKETDTITWLQGGHSGGRRLELARAEAMSTGLDTGNHSQKAGAGADADTASTGGEH